MSWHSCKISRRLAPLGPRSEGGGGSNWPPSQLKLALKKPSWNRVIHFMIEHTRLNMLTILYTRYLRIGSMENVCCTKIQLSAVDKLHCIALSHKHIGPLNSKICLELTHYKQVLFIIVLKFTVNPFRIMSAISRARGLWRIHVLYQNHTVFKLFQWTFKKMYCVSSNERKTSTHLLMRGRPEFPGLLGCYDRRHVCVPHLKESPQLILQELTEKFNKTYKNVWQIVCFYT